MSTSIRARVLVVDDEANILEALGKVLGKEGLEVRTAANGRIALDLLRKEPFDVMLTDLRMPGMTGDDLLRAAKKLTPEVEVIVMTAYGTVENAVEAMKHGAYDFISKPLKRASVQSPIVGNSQIMRATLEMATQAANSSATVLLLQPTQRT
jgi:two-component system response regulator HydG